MIFASRKLQLLLSTLLLVSWAHSINAHEDFLDCLLQSHNSTSTIYSQENSTYSTILQSSIQNLRPPSQSTLRPQFIITPWHESEIQSVIYCSKKHGLQIRVRSGGHDYEGLSYTSQVPFVILDLRNLRSISIDTEAKTAWVGAGATLGEFYHAIAEKSTSLAFPAGTCPTVGVGGHFSGGGYSMMSRKFGLSADNIIDAVIIDVDGRVLDRRSMGEDLFWAIRGGGGASFGVIVSWKVNLLSVPENVTVFNVTRTLEENATQLVHRWQYVGNQIDENLLIRLFISSVTSNTTGNKTIEVSFTSLYIGGVNDLLEIMQKSFPELGLVREDCTEMRWIESILYFAYFPLPDESSSFDILLNRSSNDPVGYSKGKSDYVTHPITEDGLRGLWQRLHQLDEVVSGLQFSPYGGKLAEILESETPFPHRAGNLYMIHYIVVWDQQEISEASRYISWIRKLYSYMAAYVSRNPRRAYMNYRDLDLGVNNVGRSTGYRQASRWGRRYFNHNFDRLVHVKTKIDPTNFFRNEQTIPSLSSK